MNAETQIPHFQYPQLQRERDISLMEAFQTKYTGKKILAQLNRCRVLLQVITLFDITDASWNFCSNHFEDFHCEELVGFG